MDAAFVAVCDTVLMALKEGPLPDGYLLGSGDLIVAMTEQADGGLGSAALVPSYGKYLHNQRIGKVNLLSPKLSVAFLYRIFNSGAYRAKVRKTAAGSVSQAARKGVSACQTTLFSEPYLVSRVNS